MQLEEALIAKIIIFWRKKIERTGLQSEKKFKNIDFGLSGSIFFYCTIFPVLAYYILHILEDSPREKILIVWIRKKIKCFGFRIIIIFVINKNDLTNP